MNIPINESDPSSFNKNIDEDAKGSMMHPFAQQGNIIECDALVIGTGLAGLNYCLTLNQLNNKLKIALISKAAIEDCNSRYAQGGIAAAIAEQDSLEAHIADTLSAGDGLCYKPTVKAILKEAPEVINDLIKKQVSFTKDALGNYALAQEGGHSNRRIFNCGDYTGLDITQALLNAIKHCPQITVFEHHAAINLITHYHPHRTDIQGEVIGAHVLDVKQSVVHSFLAKSVILATGGAGKTYRYTSNPIVATGDGVAMAYRAGARVGNMEFYQFHPTLLYHPTLNNFLISEAVRGEGALLVNAETGKPFMQRYAPEKAELATRDIVARAIFNEIEHSETGYVHLDIRHQSRAFLEKRFPQIYKTLQGIGIDMAQDLIPVVPAAHYQCGGVLTNLQGQTDLKRLYAIGEVAFNGLHGANRLASNSLLEALVMGKTAAEASLADLKKPLKQLKQTLAWHSPRMINPRRASQINAQWHGLRSEMTSYAGIVRTEAGLLDVLQLICQRKKTIEEYYWKHCITRDFIELRNIILNAELIVRSALSRRESRGGHFREDYPTKNRLAQESILRFSMPQSPYF